MYIRNDTTKDVSEIKTAAEIESFDTTPALRGILRCVFPIITPVVGALGKDARENLTDQLWEDLKDHPEIIESAFICDDRNNTAEVVANDQTILTVAVVFGVGLGQYSFSNKEFL